MSDMVNEAATAVVEAVASGTVSQVVADAGNVLDAKADGSTRIEAAIDGVNASVAFLHHLFPGHPALPTVVAPETK